jgi:predicted DNA-binding transcriptional regulator AlpA
MVTPTTATDMFKTQTAVDLFKYGERRSNFLNCDTPYFKPIGAELVAVRLFEIVHTVEAHQASAWEYNSDHRSMINDRFVSAFNKDNGLYHPHPLDLEKTFDRWPEDEYEEWISSWNPLVSIEVTSFYEAINYENRLVFSFYGMASSDAFPELIRQYRELRLMTKMRMNL